MILNALTKARLPNVVEAELFMRMQYETAFGIYNHDAPDSRTTPWPLLAVSPKESLTNVDPLDFRLDQFIENRVYELTGISFDELITWPRYDFLKVIASCKKHSAKLLQAGNGLKNLEKMLQQQAQPQSK